MNSTPESPSVKHDYTETDDTVVTFPISEIQSDYLRVGTYQSFRNKSGGKSNVTVSESKDRTAANKNETLEMKQARVRAAREQLARTNEARTYCSLEKKKLADGVRAERKMNDELIALQNAAHIKMVRECVAKRKAEAEEARKMLAEARKKLEMAKKTKKVEDINLAQDDVRRADVYFKNARLKSLKALEADVAVKDEIAERAREEYEMAKTNLEEAKKTKKVGEINKAQDDVRRANIKFKNARLESLKAVKAVKAVKAEIAETASEEYEMAETNLEEAKKTEKVEEINRAQKNLEIPQENVRIAEENVRIAEENVRIAEENVRIANQPTSKVQTSNKSRAVGSTSKDQTSNKFHAVGSTSKVQTSNKFHAVGLKSNLPHKNGNDCKTSDAVGSTSEEQSDVYKKYAIRGRGQKNETNGDVAVGEKSNSTEKNGTTTQQNRLKGQFPLDVKIFRVSSGGTPGTTHDITEGNGTTSQQNRPDDITGTNGPARKQDVTLARLRDPGNVCQLLQGRSSILKSLSFPTNGISLPKSNHQESKSSVVLNSVVRNSVIGKSFVFPHMKVEKLRNVLSHILEGNSLTNKRGEEVKFVVAPQLKSWIENVISQLHTNQRAGNDCKIVVPPALNDLVLGLLSRLKRGRSNAIMPSRTNNGGVDQGLQRSNGGAIPIERIQYYVSGNSTNNKDNSENLDARVINSLTGRNRMLSGTRQTDTSSLKTATEKSDHSESQISPSDRSRDHSLSSCLSNSGESSDNEELDWDPTVDFPLHNEEPERRPFLVNGRRKKVSCYGSRRRRLRRSPSSPNQYCTTKEFKLNELPSSKFKVLDKKLGSRVNKIPIDPRSRPIGRRVVLPKHIFSSLKTATEKSDHSESQVSLTSGRHQQSNSLSSSTKGNSPTKSGCPRSNSLSSKLSDVKSNLNNSSRDERVTDSPTARNRTFSGTSQTDRNTNSSSSEPVIALGDHSESQVSSRHTWLTSGRHQQSNSLSSSTNGNSPTKSGRPRSNSLLSFTNRNSPTKSGRPRSNSLPSKLSDVRSNLNNSLRDERVTDSPTARNRTFSGTSQTDRNTNSSSPEPVIALGDHSESQVSSRHTWLTSGRHQQSNSLSSSTNGNSPTKSGRPRSNSLLSFTNRNSPTKSGRPRSNSLPSILSDVRSNSNNSSGDGRVTDSPTGRNRTFSGTRQTDSNTNSSLPKTATEASDNLGSRENKVKRLKNNVYRYGSRTRTICRRVRPNLGLGIRRKIGNSSTQSNRKRLNRRIRGSVIGTKSQQFFRNLVGRKVQDSRKFGLTRTSATKSTENGKSNSGQTKSLTAQVIHEASYPRGIPGSKQCSSLTNQNRGNSKQLTIENSRQPTNQNLRNSKQPGAQIERSGKESLYFGPISHRHYTGPELPKLQKNDPDAYRALVVGKKNTFDIHTHSCWIKENGVWIKRQN